MFQIERFYEQCESGEKVNEDDILQYVHMFDRVIIWGAAGLGKAIGALLETWKIKEIIYWDERWQEIGSINNRVIELPFSKDYSRGSTLVLYSIPNHVIMKELLDKLRKNGYVNIIRGDILYSGLICPYCKEDRPTATRCWMKGECRSVICKRLQNIIKSKETVQKPGSRIDLTYNCFIINSICNLNCTHCVQFINNYPAKARVNISTESICRDIDLWLELIDSVGTISVMGGETFMHPDVAQIAQKFCEHDNFGFVSFPTNGLFPIRSEQLEGIEDSRIVIAFGAYQHIANAEQLEIYEKNVELVKSYGIAYTESRHLPTWVVPAGLWKVSDEVEYLTRKKDKCIMPPRNLQIRDGKVHTCDRGVALYGMGVADYPEDYFELNMSETLEKKRQLFREFIERPYYRTCGHCGGAYGTAPSALQGEINVFDESAYKDVDWYSNS